MTLAAEARLTEVQKDEREKAQARAKVELANLKQDFDATFGTGHGQRVLRHIMTICGYDKSSVVGDQFGNPLAEGTIYNAAQQNIYRAIRRLVRHEILIPVEHERLEQDQTDIFS